MINFRGKNIFEKIGETVLNWKRKSYRGRSTEKNDFLCIFEVSAKIFCYNQNFIECKGKNTLLPTICNRAVKSWTNFTDDHKSLNKI